jgi:hypothetical protein
MVPVPKATVHENRSTKPGKKNVRRAREISPMEAVSIASREQDSAHGSFGRGIFSPDGRHHL